MNIHRTVLISPAEPRDIPAITEIYNHAILHTTATFDTEEKPIPEMEKWLSQHSSKYPVFFSKSEQLITGWASITPWSDRCAYSSAVENSIYVHPSFRGQNIGTKLLEHLIQVARELNYHTMIARIGERNPVSMRLHLKAGFKSIGIMREVGYKFDAFLDVEILQLLL